MTECNRSPLVFSSLNRRKLAADFLGGDLTSDGGLPLLREVDRRIGLIDRLSAAIRDPRDPDRIEHDQRTLLAQRILAMAAGYEDLNDHQALRTDTLLQTLTDRRLKAGQKEGDPLASPPTLCRLENRITRRDLVRMAAVLVEAYVASYPVPPQEVVLDFDATDDLVHGRQEGRFFHGYYDAYCFLPLYVFAGDQLLAAYLRPSNIDGAKHSLRDPEATGRAAAAGVARGPDRLPCRQRVLPVASAAVVRPARRGLSRRPGPQRGPGAARPDVDGRGRGAR